MKIIIQRAKQASVRVEGNTIGSIASGLVLFIGIHQEDTAQDVSAMVEKVSHLRIFADEQGKMNRSLLDAGGRVLSISQFTLYGDTRKGRRPNFMNAAGPKKAEILYDLFNTLLREKGIQVETGLFGAKMDVALINDGPVTLIVESP